MRSRTRSTRALGVALSLAALTALSACGGDDAFDEPTSGSDPDTTPGDSSTPGESDGAGATGEITVGGANFTEMLVMQEVYAALLRDAGFTVDIISVDNRETYEASLESGDIDVIPEYAATMAEYLNIAANGDDAEAVASSDVDDTVAALTELAEPLGLTVLEPAEAADQNAFVVSSSFAEDNNLTTLSDLAALGEPITLAATAECPERPFCQIGLEDLYGLDISEVIPLGYGTLETKTSVQNGESQLGLTGTTDGSLDQFDLVVLDDDKGLQNADNLVPLVNSETLTEFPAIEDVLDGLSDVLTTDALAAMILSVDTNRELPADVATEFLTEQGLIG